MGAKSKVEVLIALKDVPVGAIVTKPTGEKKYRVADKISFFGKHPETGDSIDSVSFTGVRFLVAEESAHIDCQPLEHVVKWKTTLQDLASSLGCWVDEIEDK